MIDIYTIKIGDKITPKIGLKLCKYFGFNYLVRRLEGNLDNFESFTFDGVSGLPDNLAAFLANVKERDFTYLVALPHDIQFMYGDPGNKVEEKMANNIFRNNFIKIGAKSWRIKIALIFIKIIGAEKLKFSFSWARKRK